MGPKRPRLLHQEVNEKCFVLSFCVFFFSFLLLTSDAVEREPVQTSLSKNSEARSLFYGEVQGYSSSMGSFTEFRATQKCHQILPSLPLSPSLLFVSPWGVCLRMKPVGRKAKMATGGPCFCLAGLSPHLQISASLSQEQQKNSRGQFSLARPGRSEHLLPRPCGQGDKVLAPTTQMFYGLPGSWIQESSPESSGQRVEKDRIPHRKNRERELTPG